jgi:hypothetical protein
MRVEFWYVCVPYFGLRFSLLYFLFSIPSLSLIFLFYGTIYLGHKINMQLNNFAGVGGELFLLPLQ